MIGSIRHSGGRSVQSGHYIATVKCGDDAWFICNDTNITGKKHDDVQLKEIHENAYILFYQLRDSEALIIENAQLEQYYTQALPASGAPSIEAIKDRLQSVIKAFQEQNDRDLRIFNENVKREYKGTIIETLMQHMFIAPRMEAVEAAFLDGDAAPARQLHLTPDAASKRLLDKFGFK